MPVKIEPRLSGGPGHIGERSKLRLVGDSDDVERRAVAIEPGIKVKRHADFEPKPIEKIVKIKMLQDRIAAPDLVYIQEYKKGKEYDVPEFLAGPWFEKNLAVKISKTAKGDKK